jgi:hypothetical protein
MTQVSFDDWRGSLTWTLPPDAVAAMAVMTPEMRQRCLESFSSNLGVVCGAVLRSFGDPGVAETFNLIMREMHEIAAPRADW